MIERIDDTIDRVASEMTDVPANEAFAAGLRDRLREAPRSRVDAVGVLSFAATTLAIAIVGWQFFSRGASSPFQRESVTADATASSSPSDSAVLSDARPLVPPAPLAPTAAADAVAVSGPIAPLVLMDDLAVPPVNVAPLAVENLAISDLAGGSEFEEPR
jgi:hypothetical protein